MRLKFTATLVALAVAGCQGRPADSAADLVLTHAYVYTVDANRSVAEAVAIRGNEIVSAIAAFTINGAKLFDHDGTVGSIEVGKKADIIALNRNVVELAETGRASEIGTTEVTLKIFDGEIVFEAPR